MSRLRAVASGTRPIHSAVRAGAGALAVAAAVAFGVVLGPVSAASADTAVTSITDLANAFSTEASGSTITLDDDVTGNADSPAVAVPAGRTLTLDLNGHRLTVIGTSDDNGDNGTAGLGVPTGTSLTIIDSAPGGNVGTLTATGGIGAAGIGGGAGEGSGSITIDGGTITASSVFAGAGIGGGWPGSGGTTTINGGTVNATAGDEAAAIGGGHSGNGGIVTINSGVVTATSHNDGAAIGGGVGRDGAAVSIGAGADVTVVSDGGASAVGPGNMGTGFGSLSNAGRLSFQFPSSIDIPSGATVVNSGTIRNAGVLSVEGTLVNTGTILGAGTIVTPAHVTGHNTTVVLNGNDGTAPADPAVIYSRSFQDGQIAFPGDATRSGRTFTGWFTQATGGTRVVASTDLGLGGPKSVTLYAQWNQPVSAVTGSTPAPGKDASNTEASGGIALAATGSDLAPIGLIGAALVLLGLAIRLRRRRTV